MRANNTNMAGAIQVCDALIYLGDSAFEMALNCNECWQIQLLDVHNDEYTEYGGGRLVDVRVKSINGIFCDSCCFLLHFFFSNHSLSYSFSLFDVVWHTHMRRHTDAYMRRNTYTHMRRTPTHTSTLCMKCVCCFV